MENLSNMCICLHGSGARRPPYTHYFQSFSDTNAIYFDNELHVFFLSIITKKKAHRGSLICSDRKFSRT